MPLDPFSTLQKHSAGKSTLCDVTKCINFSLWFSNNGLNFNVWRPKEYFVLFFNF